MKFLIVEDDLNLLELIRAMFAGQKSSDINLLLAKNLQEAKEIVESEDNIDVAFIDERLPDGLGTEVGLLLRKKNPNCEVWICSAWEVSLGHLEKNTGVKAIPKDECMNLIMKKLINQ